MNYSGRVIWIVLDGVGLEALPDACDFGDEDAATLPHVAKACNGLCLPEMQKLGLGNLSDIQGVPPVNFPVAAYGRLSEKSSGKDSIIGHWELSGVLVDKPFATFPQGFPEDLIKQFTHLTGLPPLGNIAAGGISILRQFGAEHVLTGRPIVYTSVDSVFQIAAHEDIMPPKGLYDLCMATKKLTDAYNIARVIARPFIGNQISGFKRTSRRKDFTSPPPQKTVLDFLMDKGIPVTAVGKITDLFSGRGISKSVHTESNQDGMNKIVELLDGLNHGLLIANLIDFDMVYGHRNDPIGFGRAVEEFDSWLPKLYDKMLHRDLLVICADHGCDPTTPGSDHTREFVPVLAWSKAMCNGVPLGDRQSFSDVGATLAEYFSLNHNLFGESFLKQLDLQKTTSS